MIINLKYLTKIQYECYWNHLCEEKAVYNKWGINDNNIVLIEADSDTYSKISGQIKNIYNVEISEHYLYK